MKTLICLLLFATGPLLAHVPGTDVANITNSTVFRAESIARWVGSTAQLNQQISIQSAAVDRRSCGGSWQSRAYLEPIRVRRNPSNEK